jgi:transcriptional regulator with XRE-family HTH domain
MNWEELSKPKRLAEKLLAIRKSLNLSQNELIRWLDLTDKLKREEISAFERGVRVPPLLVLLRYARKFGVNVEILIDDELQLNLKKKNQNDKPNKIP